MQFESDEDFKARLKDQPQEVSVAITTRAALRVWPIVLWHWFWKERDIAKKSAGKPCTGSFANLR